MMVATIRRALQDASARLSSVSESAMLDAEILLAQVLKASRTYLYVHADDELTADDLRDFDEMVDRRLLHEPVAYITGHKEFWSLDLRITKDVLIPRPETEVLVEEVLTLFPDLNEQLTVADLGAGSGAIALALASERPGWSVYAVDISQGALQLVSDNAQRLGIDNISICHGNWFTALPAGKLDIVVSNPPYISLHEWEEYAAGLQYEPRQALLSGEDGLDDIREICHRVHDYLKPGGYLFVEHGYAQAEAVRELFAASGFDEVRTVKDLSANDRVTIGRLKSHGK